MPHFIERRIVGKTQRPSDKDHRKQIDASRLNIAIEQTVNKLFERLDEKGYGTWLSRHEILGFLTEEYTEAVEAVHSGTIGDLEDELKDLAVGCIFALACINSDGLDW